MPFDLINIAPCVLHFIPAGEECGIPGHGVEEEAFVGLRAGLAETVRIMEVHLDPLGAHGRSGDFHLHAQGDAFIRLDADDRTFAGSSAVPRLNST